MYVTISTNLFEANYYGHVSKTMYFFDSLEKAETFAGMHDGKYKVCKIDNGSMLEIETQDDGKTDYCLKDSNGKVLDHM